MVRLNYSLLAIRHSPSSLFPIRAFPDRNPPHGCARVIRFGEKDIGPANHYRPGLRLIFGRKTGMAAPLTATQKPAISAMTDARDYSATLFLPHTDFPMRAGLPQKEPELLERWRRLDIYRRLRRAAAGRARFILHDGPPYANGNIHIGTALNKILKDVVTRSQQMLGFDSNYVPGWDCHGLPIEWKVEEEYRAKGKNKDAVPLVEFRRECRAFAAHWVEVQRGEFKRLGVEGDWAHPY